MAEGAVPTRPTLLAVDLDAVRRNAERLKRHAGGGPLLAVVKADAYGHGAIPVAKALEASHSAQWFGVSLAEEGLQLRQAGISLPILLLGPASLGQGALILQYRLSPAVYSIEFAVALESACSTAGLMLGVHLKVDSGMGRLGFRPEELPALLETLRKCPHLRVEGLFSNLASADNPASPQTAQQVRTFGEMLAAVRAAGHDPSWVDLANSSGLLAHPESRFQMVRPGLALYGLRPSEALPDIGLELVTTLTTAVAQVKSLPAGAPVGYSATFVAPRPMRVAILPLGYADGLPRSLGGNVGHVLLRGERCPLVGRVSMDLCAVDLGQLEGIAAGEPVTLWGRSGDHTLTPWEWARWAGTIPYEITCHIGARVARRYLLDGREVLQMPLVTNS